MMNRKIKQFRTIVYAVIFIAGLVACSDRNNESGSDSSTNKTNVSDSRRNTTDTGNYTVDSTGRVPR
jgi:hypothetical protein